MCGIINPMGHLNVKNTMLRSFASLMFPHYCCSCGEIGDVLCANCKYDIISEYTPKCLHCQGPLASSDSSCGSCHLAFDNAWWVGHREGSLGTLVSVSKFESQRRGCEVQAELLHAVMPKLQGSIVVVPVPTIARHIRQRGYGHAEKIAKTLAHLRGYVYSPVVERQKQYVQHGSKRKDRERQATESYAVAIKLPSDSTYLVVDDVYTTGFTSQYVAKALRDAGARRVYVAITSRQPLDAQR